MKKNFFYCFFCVIDILYVFVQKYKDIALELYPYIFIVYLSYASMFA